MDLELLRTFVEVDKTRHFARAAENLHVSQAAVSARIAQLEELIGQPIFTRSRNNIQLTSTGQQLLPYARSMLLSWSQALMETHQPGTSGPLQRIVCLPSLREIYLEAWVSGILSAPGDWLLHVHCGSSREIVDQLRQNTAEVGLLYEPPQAADLWVTELTSFDLILVSTLKQQGVAGLNDYIDVDWGSALSSKRQDGLSNLPAARLKVDSPTLALKMLQQRGGSAYLAEPMVDQGIRKKKLHRVADAPAIRRRVFAIGRNSDDADGSTAELLDALRTFAQRPG